MITIWPFFGSPSNPGVRHVLFDIEGVCLQRLGQNKHNPWFFPFPFYQSLPFYTTGLVGGISPGHDCPPISVWECIKGLKPFLSCKHLCQPSLFPNRHLFSNQLISLNNLELLESAEEFLSGQRQPGQLVQNSQTAAAVVNSIPRKSVDILKI